MDFLTPSTAFVILPFLPNPSGHSPDFSSDSVLVSAGSAASLSESARRRPVNLAPLPRPDTPPGGTTARGRFVLGNLFGVVLN